MTDYDDVSDTIHLQGLGSALPTFSKSGVKLTPSMAYHFREHATFRHAMLPGFTRIIGVLGTLALREQAPGTFGRLEGTQTTVGLSGKSLSLINPVYDCLARRVLAK